MALYAIGDLHLSFGTNKPMDVFGGAWSGYVEKLVEGLSVIGPEDTTVLLGDVSWAMNFQQAVEDFSFINNIAGRKLILKGNHDYWWSTVNKFSGFCNENGFTNMQLLHNNCFEYEGVALCGTRGWFFEEDQNGHNEKVYNREMLRLEASLKEGGEREKFCFLHYPPRYKGYQCPEILALLEQYHVSRCYYGHLHGYSQNLAMEGDIQGVEYSLVAADYLDFIPRKVLE